jgi:hypothetical protein
MRSARLAIDEGGGGEMRHVRVGERARRWRATVAVVAGLLAWTVGVGTAGSAGAAGDNATAAADGGEELTVSGSFAATGTFGSTTDCPAFHTVHTGEGSWTGLGDVTFLLDYCVVLGSEELSPLSGTIAITAAEGTLAGTIEGAVSTFGGPDGFTADYTATITGGTGAYADATGALDLAGVWDDPEIPVRSMHGTVSGTVELPAPPLAHPSSVRDCIQGRWRNFVDDDGEPFSGPWDCIFYVVTHWRR